MKIIVVGAAGTIGKKVVENLSKRHEIIKVGRNSGDHQVDITNPADVAALFKKIGNFDALVSAAGEVHFGPLESLGQEQLQVGIKSKLLGQINLVLEGMKHISDRGSFTLTSGILTDDPIPNGTAASMTNAALEGFVLGAAIELPRGIRINIVSPTVVEESMENFGPYFRGFDPVPAAKAALAYEKSVEGLLTGKVLKVVGAV